LDHWRTWVSVHFWPLKRIPSGSSHTNFWLLFHFHVKYWPISIFLGLIWCKILCWAQKNILYGVLSPIESLWSPKPVFVSHEIFISRVTYPSIRNFMLSSKSILYEVWNATGSHESPKTGNSNKSCKKILIFSVKNLLSVWNWKSFLQLSSKLILKLFISFMNRKSNCGYATYFFEGNLVIFDFYCILRIFVNFRFFMDYFLSDLQPSKQSW
jgi:hypothetical protein